MATKFYNLENNSLANGQTKKPVIGHVNSNRPLDIAIIGAGIGGLSAAIGLRRNGHNVSVSLSNHQIKYIIQLLTFRSCMSNPNLQVKPVLQSTYNPTAMGSSDDGASQSRTSARSNSTV